mmetsp:Transcript_13742/g.39090  ORF Transcript_13742/g.39090 Transcript_13742/m.39090 type:complete len:227 (+) Transcript_13742:173-853(+)
MFPPSRRAYPWTVGSMSPPSIFSATGSPTHPETTTPGAALAYRADPIPALHTKTQNTATAPPESPRFAPSPARLLRERYPGGAGTPWTRTFRMLSQPRVSVVLFPASQSRFPRRGPIRQHTLSIGSSDPDVIPHSQSDVGADQTERDRTCALQKRGKPSDPSPRCKSTRPHRSALLRKPRPLTGKFVAVVATVFFSASPEVPEAPEATKLPPRTSSSGPTEAVCEF